MVVDDPNSQRHISGEIHADKFVPKVFDHVLGELTIAVDRAFHGRGIGKILFTTFLHYVATTRPDILRVELLTQESNSRALSLYKRVGFVAEGRIEWRIRMYNNRLDADIPMVWFNPNFKETTSSQIIRLQHAHLWPAS